MSFGALNETVVHSSGATVWTKTPLKQHTKKFSPSSAMPVQRDNTQNESEHASMQMSF
jgi:hypothetical protein